MRICSDKQHFLHTANPTNLTIRTDVLVNRVLFDSNKKCIGIEFYDMAIKTNTIYQVKVNNDVILSAGSIGTPQILMLSGVGPSDQLGTFGITVISDLSGVGSNLQEDLYLTAAVMSKQYVDHQPCIWSTRCSYFLAFQLVFQGIWW